MNFSRKTILVVGAALLAACGDKVTVQEYTPPATTAKVNFVEVTPATATVNTGASITFTAAVNADAGLATTVTWTASAGTVTSAGVFTAPATANPGISVCAASTVDTGKKGCATVVVSPTVTAIPATVSINSITAGGLTTPVNPANVANQIDVTLNINPGNQTISKVELLIDGAVAGTQSFSAAQSAALRFAADEAVAAQTTFPQVVFSINTAAYNATTGIPTWYNGSHTIQAKVYTAATATASVSQNLTFNNANTYELNSTVSGTPVIGANFYKYTTGSITATVIPVIYTSGLSLASGNLTFGAAGCDATAPRVVTLASNVATFTRSNAAGPAAGNFRLYEFRSATPACPIATGEGFTLTAIDNAGNQLFAAAAPANNAANLYRLDNVAPGAPTLTQNPGARQNGWVNAAIGFTTTTVASAANGMFVDGAADLGVGGYTRWARIAAPTTTGTVANAIAATASTTPTLPVPSLSPTDYCLVASATDALGNETTLPTSATVCSAPAVASATALAATHTRFGVDIAAPQVSFSGGLASNGRIIGATIGGEFQVTVLDTGTVGNSGMLSGSSVMGTVMLRNATATGAATCPLGAWVAPTCSPVSVNAAPVFPLVPTTTVAAMATNGYYTYTAYAQDAAGNASGTVTRVTALDQAANIPTLSTAIFTTPLSSGSVTFSATAADNLDLRDVTYNLTYAGGLAGPIVYPTITLGTYNGTPLVNTAVPAGITIPNFVRQVEDVTSLPAGPLTVSGAYKPNNIQGNLRDVVNNASGAVNTGILAAQVTTGVSYTLAAAPLLINSWAISNAAASVSDGAPVAPAVAANATSITLNADAFGPTATFNAPFARVDFYVLFGGQLVQIGTTTSFTTVDNGAAFGRRHRYSISWTPGTTFGLGVLNVYALGVNAAGDGLVTLASANITITNP